MPSRKFPIDKNVWNPATTGEFRRYDFPIVTKEKINEILHQKSKSLEICKFQFKDILFYSHFNILKQSRYFWAPRICV